MPKLAFLSTLMRPLPNPPNRRCRQQPTRTLFTIPLATPSLELLEGFSAQNPQKYWTPSSRNYHPIGPTPAVSVSGSQSASQSTSSSQGHRKVRFGSYDPADDLVSWDNPGDPNCDRTGETTGPQLFTPEQEELQRRANNVLYHDDYAGNLEFGKSRQTLLDGFVRPLREIRGTSTNASPSRRAAAPPPAQTPSVPVLPITIGPSIGDDPANPVIIDDDSSRHASPSPEELRIAARHYVRTVIRPDRERRRRGIQSDDEAMQGVTAAQLPPFQLPYDDSSSDEDEVEDDAQPVATVLVPNSSGSALGNDNNGDDSAPAENSKKSGALSEWHEDQLHDLELEDQMERLYPMREFVKKTPVAATPLGKLFTKKKVSAQPSMSSLGDIADGDHISNFSKEYPPNQEGYMRMHRTNLSDADTGATIPLFYLVISSVLTITIQNHRCIPRSRFELSTLPSHRLAREMPPTRTNYLTTLAPTLDPITSPSPPTIP
jgi:hypothetical protein